MAEQIITFGAALDANALKRDVAQANRSLGSMKSSFRQVRTAALALTATGVGLALLGKRFLRLGSDALETRNKFLVTFGDSAKAVDKFLREFNLISGLSKETSENLISDTAAIVQAFGFSQKASADFSQSVLRLAGDLASFKNVKAEDAVQAINVALVGQRERLQSLGIVIRQVDVDQRALVNTGKDSAKQLTDQEKAVATLELAYDRAGVAVGDLGRTSESTANVMKQLGAAWKDFQNRLGEFLAQSPMVNAFLIGIRDMLRDMTKILSGNADQIGRAFELLGIAAANAFSFGFLRTLESVLGPAFVSPLLAQFAGLLGLFRSIGDEAAANIKGAFIELSELAADIKLPDDMGGTPGSGTGPGAAPPAFKRMTAGAKMAQDSFADLFTQLGTKGVSDFRGFVDALIAEWQRFIAQILASKIIEFAAGALGIGVETKRGGGIVGSGGPMTTVPIGAFAKAPHFAGGGIVGDAVPIIAHRGEMVVPRSQVGKQGMTINQTINLTLASVDNPSGLAFLRMHKGTIAELMGEAAQESPGFARMIRGR